MTRFLIYSFALVPLHPIGVDMYLVELPRIAADLQASEAQPRIAFSVYLAGMATAMLSAGKIADQSGRKPVVVAGVLIFIFASVLCSFVESGTPPLVGRFVQSVGAGCCYVVAFAILCDTLDDRRRAKVLSLLNGITYIVPVLVPVIGHLVMLKFPWQGLFYMMVGMDVAVYLSLVFVLRESRPITLMVITEKNHTTESLVNRLSLSRLVVTTLSVSTILAFVNTSPVLLMEMIGLDRGEYAITITVTTGISMAIFSSTLFALSIFRPRVLMLTLQVLFLRAGMVLALATSHVVALFGLTLICVESSVGFGVATSQALGPFPLRTDVASSTLGIAQACGPSLRVWLAAVLGFDALSMLIGILIGCSIVSIMLAITVAPNRSAPTREEIPRQSRS